MKIKSLKRMGAAVMAVCMLSVFSACGNNDADDTPAADGSESTASTEESKAAVNDEIRDISSMELLKELKIGWSLGNTLDADGSEGVDAETSWGNPKTTKEMITKVKEAGFNIVRIPVTWRPHLDAENNIDKEWMDRVQEVVDYAYSQDMFVILNAHHEEWYDPYYDKEEEITKKLKYLWEQIGTRFANYDERLIFEGMNEPRKRNTALEWNGGDKEGHDVVNNLNAAFIETIRGLGGNNAKRHLMIPTYAASSSRSAINDFVMPEGDDKLIVSIHAYLPYGFALDGDVNNREFTPDVGSASEIVDFMDLLKTTFVDKNIPVIIGEFGARSKVNTDIRAEWATYYVSKAHEIGVPCVLWDNHAFTGTGENFGMLDRKTCEWRYPEIVEGLMKGLE